MDVSGKAYASRHDLIGLKSQTPAWKFPTEACRSLSTSWKSGHTTIATLVQSGHLERISGDAANGDYCRRSRNSPDYLLEQARRRLAGARAANDADHVGAFELAYDSTRQAITALLVQQGLRPKVEGGHIAVADAVTAQFGQGFRAFNRMRRIRNQLEYPRSPADLELEQADTQQALTDAASIISTVEQLLSELGMSVSGWFGPGRTGRIPVNVATGRVSH